MRQLGASSPRREAKRTASYWYHRLRATRYGPLPETCFECNRKRVHTTVRIMVPLTVQRSLLFYPRRTIRRSRGPCTLCTVVVDMK